MGVPAVFISSVQSGFADFRAAARAGVEAAGMHPVMAEDAAAAADAPRGALLDQVARCDIYLLILGARYGDAGASGFSPTEDEFNHAVNLAKPILVFVLEPVEMEPEQRAFLARVREGGWEDGTLNAMVATPEELKIEVLRALHAHASSSSVEQRDVGARVAELVPRRRRGSQSAVIARCVFVPLNQATVLDVLDLDKLGLGDQVAGLIRAAGLIPQSVGLTASVNGEGVRVDAKDSRDWATPEFALLADGSVVAEASVAGDGQFGGSLVDEAKTQAFIAHATDFASSVWVQYDKVGAVRQVAAVIIVPDAGYKSFGTVSGSRMTMATRNPETIIAPPEPLVSQRTAVTGEDFRQRLLASLRRAFADLDAVVG